MFTHHLNPHHVHKETSCRDHSDCPEDHWIGGRPDPNHPHHVEHNVKTGLTGYTRLTKKEIMDNEKRWAEEAIKQKEREDNRKAEIDQLKTRALTDPDFALLLKHLKIGDTK